MPFDLVTWKAKVVVEAARAAGAGASGFRGWCAHDSGGIQRVPPLAVRCASWMKWVTLTCAYPKCRIVVTSRIVGYTGAARLGEDFTTTTIRDFTLADVEQFLTHWHRLVAIGQMGPGESAEHVAALQTRHLMDAVRSNPRVRELAINPLMLTVIALVHRDRVKLPERRAELYAEAVDVLLGKWDEAREVAERENYVAYTLARAAEPFWREVILLEAGYLSTKNPARTTRLIRAIADSHTEPELFHNLVLAAECMRDVGPTRVGGDLAANLSRRLQRELERPIPAAATGLAGVWGMLTRVTERRKVIVRRRMSAATALSRIESGRFGTGSPYMKMKTLP